MSERITDEVLQELLRKLRATTGKDFHIRGDGQGKVIAVEAVEPDLERRVGPPLSRPEMAVFLRGYDNGYSRCNKDQGAATRSVKGLE